MSPLEVMAKAVWDRFSGGRIPWEEVGERAREGMLGDMRTAVLALAEAELPQRMEDPRGVGVYPHERDGMYRDAFRSMLRSIAEGKG